MTVKVRFAGHKEVDAEIGDTILGVALREHVPLDHACGGVCACSTCHVRVVKGMDALSEREEEEDDQLDTARGLALNSRLSCQARILRPPKDGVIEVEIPEWNVNLIREGAG